jgi:predicted PurR-regulated permease PerM
MVMLLLAVVFLLLIPQLSETLQMLIPSLMNFVTDIGNRINAFLESNPELMQ